MRLKNWEPCFNKFLSGYYKTYQQKMKMKEEPKVILDYILTHLLTNNFSIKMFPQQTNFFLKVIEVCTQFFYLLLNCCKCFIYTSCQQWNWKLKYQSILYVCVGGCI